MTYTAAAVAGVVVTIVADHLLLRSRVLRRRTFWASYAVVLTFQLLVNGVLTCREVVTYDRDVITGVRVACAPVEDLLFGFALVTQTVAWWEWWGRRLASRGVRRRAAAPPR